MKIYKVPHAEADDLPISYNWVEDGIRDELTHEEAQTVLLFEIAESLKALEYGEKRTPSHD